jgi:dipeptidyl aminopeptidase/acylaminoacyl peptidase
MTRFTPALAVALAALASNAQAQVDYHRADLIRTAPAKLMGVPEDWGRGFGAAIGFARPTWLADSTRFWYSVMTPRGREFVLVEPNPVRPARRLAFDNARLASAMSLAADTTFDPAVLPFRRFAFLAGEREISIRVGKRRFECDLTAYRCATRDTTTAPDPRPSVVRSPDGRWDAFTRKGNLWIRRADPTARDSVQLTTDAEPEFGYGLRAPNAPMPDPDARRPELFWSPDSRKIAVLKIDERGVQKLPVYSSTGIAPKLFQYPMAYPPDSIVPTYETHVIEVERKTKVKVDRPKQVLDVFGLTGSDQTQWSAGSDRLFMVEAERANRGARVVAADAATGVARVVLADSTATFIENASGVASGNWRVVGDDVIWWSERDGWGHLYRYGLDGRLRQQITQGPWLVDRIRHVDPVARQIYFTALGRDASLPYYGHLMRVGFDGAGLTDLTPEPGNHQTYVVPTGKVFIDVHSRLDAPHLTTLRSTVDGRKLLDLETADVSQMRLAGWTPPTPFTVKARDGVTDLHGLLYLPSRLDTTGRYPVVDRIYPGPQVGAISDWGYPVEGEPRALAELGFVVVEVNSLGTPGRSKAFHDAYYGNMGDNGIADHVAAIKQLGARHRFMDLDRVGIYGLSGGGFSSTGAILRYPDFFKVAVSGAGNHDNRSYRYEWGEKYQGRYKRDSTRGTDNFESQANYLLAKNLKGRLLLFHGDMDTNVHPAMTWRLVDALIKADKDFDMFMVPDAGHQWTPYMIKRGWDYFVRWLGGQEPPRDFQMLKCTGPELQLTATSC